MLRLDDEGDVVLDELARDQEGRFLDDLVDLQQILLGRGLLQESPDAGHDLAGAAALSNDVTDRRRNLLRDRARRGAATASRPRRW